MKKYSYFLALTAALALLSTEAALAQEGAGRVKSITKLAEYDEIIIRQKDAGKSGKVTIEINDGEVKVNGKSLDEFEDENISVRKQSPSRYRITTATSPFRTMNGSWSMENDGEPRAFLGVTTIDSDGGAKVQTVRENSAAAKAGLKKGDIITKVGDKSISSPSDLSAAINDQKPEAKVAITYKRDGKESNVTATMGTRENMFYGMAPTSPDLEALNFDLRNGLGGTVITAGRPRIGIRAQDTEEGKGVKVLSVDEGSIAEKAGIKVNDIITEFDGEQVNSADELVDASRDSREKTSINVKLNRDGKTETMELKVPKKLKTARL